MRFAAARQQRFIAESVGSCRKRSHAGGGICFGCQSWRRKTRVPPMHRVRFAGESSQKLHRAACPGLASILESPMEES
jgi:hypothetical protein